MAKRGASQLRIKLRPSQVEGHLACGDLVTWRVPDAKRASRDKWGPWGPWATLFAFVKARTCWKKRLIMLT